MENYEFLGKISEGAYGAVWKARNIADGKLVAVKRMKDVAANEEELQISLREIKLLQLCQDHPNIVQLLEAYQSSGGRLYLVFEYVPHTLLQFLQANRRGLPLHQAKNIMWQLLNAVHFLHQSEMMHRDIKPANILINDDGKVKLCDFGFARATKAEQRVLDFTTYVVTRWYRPLEVLVGDDYSNAVDIWSLGCVFVEMIVGRPLFPGKSHHQQLWLVLQSVGKMTDSQRNLLMSDPQFTCFAPPSSEHMTPLEKRFPDFTPEMMEVVHACLHYDPAQRLSAAEVMKLPFFADMDAPRTSIESGTTHSGSTGTSVTEAEHAVIPVHSKNSRISSSQTSAAGQVDCAHKQRASETGFAPYQKATPVLPEPVPQSNGTLSSKSMKSSMGVQPSVTSSVQVGEISDPQNLMMTGLGDSHCNSLSGARMTSRHDDMEQLRSSLSGGSQSHVPIQGETSLPVTHNSDWTSSDQEQHQENPLLTGSYHRTMSDESDLRAQASAQQQHQLRSGAPRRSVSFSRPGVASASFLLHDPQRFMEHTTPTQPQLYRTSEPQIGVLGSRESHPTFPGGKPGYEPVTLYHAAHRPAPSYNSGLECDQLESGIVDMSASLTDRDMCIVEDEKDLEIPNLFDTGSQAGSPSVLSLPGPHWNNSKRQTWSGDIYLSNIPAPAPPTAPKSIGRAAEQAAQKHEGVAGTRWLKPVVSSSELPIVHKAGKPLAPSSSSVPEGVWGTTEAPRKPRQSAPSGLGSSNMLGSSFRAARVVAPTGTIPGAEIRRQGSIRNAPLLGIAGSMQFTSSALRVVAVGGGHMWRPGYNGAAETASGNTLTRRPTIDGLHDIASGNTLSRRSTFDGPPETSSGGGSRRSTYDGPQESSSGNQVDRRATYDGPHDSVVGLISRPSLQVPPSFMTRLSDCGQDIASGQNSSRTETTVRGTLGGRTIKRGGLLPPAAVDPRQLRAASRDGSLKPREVPNHGLKSRPQMHACCDSDNRASATHAYLNSVADKEQPHDVLYSYASTGRIGFLPQL